MAPSKKQRAQSYGHSTPVQSKALVSEVSIARRASEHCSASR